MMAKLGSLSNRIPEKVKRHITVKNVLILVLTLGSLAYILRNTIALISLSIVAVFKHIFLPMKFPGRRSHDPYKLLNYYYDVKHFNSLKHEQRCYNYFSNIFPKSKWQWQSFREFNYLHEPFKTSYEELRNNEYESCRREGKTFSDLWFYYGNLEERQYNYDYMGEINNSVAHYKLFSRCFLDNYQEVTDDKVLQLSRSIEDQLYPWFSEELLDYNNYEINKRFRSTFKKNAFSSYLLNMKNSFQGKGIAISASNDHFQLLSGFIALLRVLGNTLPIEIIHRNDFAEFYMDDIIEIATTDELLDDNKVLMDLFNGIIDETYKDFEPFKDHIYNYKVHGKKPDAKDVKFPKQSVRFVNAINGIKDEHQGLFALYSNKLIAYFFCSFEEVLLMDGDTVPLVNPMHFFDMPEYKKGEAFFFRDRQIHDELTNETIDFFKSMFPNEYDVDYFGMHKISEEKIKSNRFLNKNMNHLVESGIVAINKNRHFSSVLMTMTIQAWKPIIDVVHGDKELYWLAQLISGDEDFELNNNYAVSLGTLTPSFKSDVEMEDADEGTGEYGTKAHELCSSHPGHIANDNKTLLWMNSGFETCKKKNRFEYDYAKELEYYGFFDPKNMDKYRNAKDYYTEALRINAALIPPSTDIQYTNVKPWFEPTRSWVMTKGCDGYTWCAYDLIGGGDYEGDHNQGKVVRFDDVTQKIYYFFGDIWMYYYNLL